MLTKEQSAILRDIGQSVAFSGNEGEGIKGLVLDNYVFKDGDLYQLTPKGERYLEELVATDPDGLLVTETFALVPRASPSRLRSGLRDVLSQMTRSSPLTMLGVAFIAGAVLAGGRRK
jgi:hypothetical protein